MSFEITQTQLAQATELRQPTIAAWMNRDPIERIDVKVLSKLAGYFGVGVWDMLEVEEDTEIKTYSTPIAIPA